MKILIPVDGSAASLAAINYVASRAGLVGVRPEVRLLNVQLPIPLRAARAVRGAGESLHWSRRHACDQNEGRT